MSQQSSSYYPPRARWFTQPVYGWYWLRRVFRLQTDCDVNALRFGQIVSALLLPGVGAVFAGRRGMARIIWVSCFVALAVFFLFYGFSVANIAGGVLVMLHVIGFEALWVRMSPDRTLSQRLVASFIVFIGLVCVLYIPLRDQLLERLVVPVQTPRGVVVMSRMRPTASVLRGDYVGYELRGGYMETYHEGVYIGSGMGIEQVLAVAGDRLQFDKQTFWINGKEHPKLSYMPASGEFVVPEKCWFIWPTFSKWSVENANPDAVTKAFMRISVVHERQYRGTPFERWFLRKQTFP